MRSFLVDILGGFCMVRSADRIGVSSYNERIGGKIRLLPYGDMWTLSVYHPRLR